MQMFPQAPLVPRICSSSILILGICLVGVAVQATFSPPHKQGAKTAKCHP